MLPAAYVAEHVDLGYAVTAHRAQGMTVDTAHVVVTGSTTRENLYVAMTRGRDVQHRLRRPRPARRHPTPHPDADDVTAKTVLFGVLQHSGAELSAHQTIEAEQEHWSSIAQLAAEYETIAAAAQRDRWVDLLAAAGSPTSRSRRPRLGLLRPARRRAAPSRGERPRHRRLCCRDWSRSGRSTTPRTSAPSSSAASDAGRGPASSAPPEGLPSLIAGLDPRRERSDGTRDGRTR